MRSAYGDSCWQANSVASVSARPSPPTSDRDAGGRGDTVLLKHGSGTLVGDARDCRVGRHSVPPARGARTAAHEACRTAPASGVGATRRPLRVPASAAAISPGLPRPAGPAGPPTRRGAARHWPRLAGSDDAPRRSVAHRSRQRVLDQVEIDRADSARSSRRARRSLLGEEWRVWGWSCVATSSREYRHGRAPCSTSSGLGRPMIDDVARRRRACLGRERNRRAQPQRACRGRHGLTESLTTRGPAFSGERARRRAEIPALVEQRLRRIPSSRVASWPEGLGQALWPSTAWTHWRGLA